MRAKVKGWHSPDIDLDLYCPDIENNFGFLLQVMIGPDSENGEESFDIMVCTPDWIKFEHAGKGPLWGRHYLIVFDYDIDGIRRFIANHVEQCDGNNWTEVANKISRIGKWEFEDYRE